VAAKTSKGATPPSNPPKKAAKAKAVSAKAVAKAAPAKPAPAKAAPPAARPAAKAKAPARRAVARPITRVVRPEPSREERRAAEPKREPRPKAEPRPLPTAPAGHAPVIKADGTPEGSVALPAALTTSAKRPGVLFQALIAALANSRQGTSATKNRSRVSGGGAKPWRQKGTGRARAGSTRSPLWRHGGVVFGPNGRRYAQRLPAKMRRAAFAEALSAQAANGRVLVIESLGFDGVDGDRLRTRDVAGWLARVGDTGRSVLVTAEFDDRVGRAGANLKTLELRTPGTLRLADILRAQTVLVHRPALDALAARAAVGAEA